MLAVLTYARISSTCAQILLKSATGNAVRREGVPPHRDPDDSALPAMNAA
jgi:hypothetical protein